MPQNFQVILHQIKGWNYFRNKRFHQNKNMQSEKTCAITFLLKQKSQ